MAAEGGPPTYRIERHTPGVLHLFRGTDLVDIDREADDDTHEDIERWGTGVAWAEDHTAIERWETPKEDEEWRVLIGIPYRYATWRMEEGDVTVWDEIDSTGWVTRRVAATRQGHVYTTSTTPPPVSNTGATVSAWLSSGNQFHPGAEHGAHNSERP